MPLLSTLAASSATTFFRDKALTNAAVVADANSGSIRMLDCDNTANSGGTLGTGAPGSVVGVRMLLS